MSCHLDTKSSRNSSVCTGAFVRSSRRLAAPKAVSRTLRKAVWFSRANRAWRIFAASWSERRLRLLAGLSGSAASWRSARNRTRSSLTPAVISASASVGAGVPQTCARILRPASARMHGPTMSRHGQ